MVTELYNLEQLNLPILQCMKKPIVIRAIELKSDIKIHTREGVLMGYEGDFVLEGIEGEIYPCDRNIFLKTYNIVKDGEIK